MTNVPARSRSTGVPYQVMDIIIQPGCASSQVVRSETGSFPGVIDYDAEAERYDATRGGPARAEAAAAALAHLLGNDVRTVLDVACGTGLVGRMLAKHGYAVHGVDRSAGMLRYGSTRLSGRVAQCDARNLPIRAGAVDAVTTVWLLHLLDDAEPVIAEAARVLRPGGLYVTTVDKARADGRTGKPGTPTDDPATVSAVAARYGFSRTGETTFVGVGNAVYQLVAFTLSV
jgi:ubiquinone/menaquinone biosynthesis C-methylase UbiE